MKQSLVLIIFLFASLGIFAQHLDIEGSAKISTMALDNAADSLVVKQSDGTLALREVSSLPDLDNQMLIYNAVNGELSITGGNTVNILQDNDWAYASGSGLTGNIYHTGDVGIGLVNSPLYPLHVDDSESGGPVGYFEQSTSNTGSHAVQGNIVINGPTKGYLGIQGSIDFDGITGLNLNGMEIGALGVSVGGSATDNVGVYGYSNWWGGVYEHSVSGHLVRLAGTTFPIEIQDNNIADPTGMVLRAQNATGEATWSGIDDLSGWETDDIEEVNLAVDTAEVHIGVNWGGPIGDKVWIRGLDPNKHPLRVQVGTGLTRFYVKSNGGTTIGAGTTNGPARGLYVYQDQTIGTSATNARLEVSNSQGIDRDTMLFVNQNSSNTTGVHYGVRVNNDPATTSTSYGYYHQRSSGANGSRYGYYTTMTGGTGLRFGVRSSLGAAAGNISSAYGIYSFVNSGATTGFSAAGYFTTSTGTNTWSVYAIGDSYFSSDVRIATTTQATGYELSVDGEIMCEDLTILDSGSWPDYVFKDDYDLLSIDEFKASIDANKHLPGIPSEAEMEEHGIHVADMQKRTIEKIEELSLYIIELHERVKALEKENVDLKSELR